ncbi:MAG: agmatine deiminase family protein, partial [Bacteroidota bacterium]
YYIANGGIVMPSFDDTHDALARDIVAKAFPDRRVAQVPAGDILVGGGGIHCITQQQPKP